MLDTPISFYSYKYLFKSQHFQAWKKLFFQLSNPGQLTIVFSFSIAAVSPVSNRKQTKKQLKNLPNIGLVTLASSVKSGLHIVSYQIVASTFVMEWKLILNLTRGSKLGGVLSDFLHSLLKILLRPIQVSLTPLIKHNLEDSLHSSQDIIVGKTSSCIRESTIPAARGTNKFFKNIQTWVCN